MYRFQIVITVCSLLCFLLLFTSCENNSHQDLDGNQNSIESGGKEIPNILYDFKRIDGEVPDSTTYEVNYVYLTDGSEVTYDYLTDGPDSNSLTLVEEGDIFLGLEVEEIRAVYEEYADGSIVYTYVYVQFRGDIEMMANLNYIDSDVGFYGVYAYTEEEAYSLIPWAIGCLGEPFFQLRESENVDNVICDGFNGIGGTIENCQITIQDFTLVFARNDAISYADLISVIYP